MSETTTFQVATGEMVTLPLATTNARCCASCAHSGGWRLLMNHKGYCKEPGVVAMQKAMGTMQKALSLNSHAGRFGHFMGDRCLDHYEPASDEQMQKRLVDEKEALRRGVAHPSGMHGTEYRYRMQLIATWEFLLDAKERAT